MLAALRSARLKQRKQNTYQICPHPLFTFAKHTGMIEEFLQTVLKSYLSEVQVTPAGVITPPFTQLLNSIKDSIWTKQQRLFPRHKIIVHGIIGTTGDNAPTVNFNTHTFTSAECGDDCVSVSLKNTACFVSVVVAGFATD
ncbi:unnamed protein product [Dicrocoelium dendriticum]|nr:unnamed protein product [Dicrocoelium dendriticum]